MAPTSKLSCSAFGVVSNVRLQGNWVEWSTGREYVGPMNLTRYYTLDEIPVFAKSGTIIPMRGKITALLGQAQKEYTHLHFKTFLGSVQGGYFNLYEDEGNNIDFISGASASKCLFVRNYK